MKPYPDTDMVAGRKTEEERVLELEVMIYNVLEEWKRDFRIRPKDILETVNKWYEGEQ